MKNSIYEMWLEFKADTIHPEASEDQVSDMKAAFYAGAHVGMLGYSNALQQPDKETGARLMQSIQQEIQVHFAQEQKRREGTIVIESEGLLKTKRAH